MQQKKIILKIRSCNLSTLVLYHLFIKNLFLKFDIKSNLLFSRKKKKKLTFLKSSHVHKKAQEQFQVINFSSEITFAVPEFKMSEIICFIKLNSPKNISFNFIISSA